MKLRRTNLLRHSYNLHYERQPPRFGSADQTRTTPNQLKPLLPAAKSIPQMANQTQVNTIRAGVDKWNDWVLKNRRSKKAEKIDLTGADLAECELRRVMLAGGTLSTANLREAVLSDAELRDALFLDTNLRRATLFRACLESANFQRADLSFANFEQSNCSAAFFHEARLFRARLRNANFARAKLSESNLRRADLSNCDLSRANLFSSDLRQAKLRGANLAKADLRLANLTGSDLSEANLQGANLEGVQLIHANLEGANLQGCRVFGVSAWGVKLANANQSDLIVTNRTKLAHPFRQESVVTVDNLEIAQFIYLLLNNAKVRTVLDAISTKVVLILGRFTADRKRVLDAIRSELRQRNFIPILFDFEKPANRDVTETVSVLAHLAKFVIADLTDAKSVPQELDRIIPGLPSVPVQPILLESEREYGMFEHFKRYPWVLDVHCYRDLEQLITDLPAKVISPAEAKSHQLRVS